MSSNLPARLPDGIPNRRQVVRATRAQERTELAILDHSLAALYDRECALIDSESIKEVTKNSLDNVLGVLDDGLEKAGDRPAARELVARAISRQEQLEDSAIMRRFGR
jgi:hypothetical protein